MTQRSECRGLCRDSPDSLPATLNFVNRAVVIITVVLVSIILTGAHFVGLSVPLILPAVLAAGGLAIARNRGRPAAP